MKMSYNYDDMYRRVFIDWIQYSDEERKANRETLKLVCPHKHIIQDYVDCGAHGEGVYISYCELCRSTFQ